jgi:hypothetical protein
MTWKVIYTNATYLGATDWLVGETDAGGGFTFRATVVVYRDGAGVYQCGGNLAVAGSLAVNYATDDAVMARITSPLAATAAKYQALAFGRAALDYGVSQIRNNTNLSGSYSTWLTFHVSDGANALQERLRVGISDVTPGNDNATTLGTASFRWSTVYAGTGTINTSDERDKEQIEEVPDEWLDAWGSVAWGRFKFRAAVAAKGVAARWHIGAAAQAVQKAFHAHGLDAAEIGLLCFDEWEAAPPSEAILDRAGNEVSPAQPGVDAGDRFGLRYDECFAMEAAWQRRELARLAARVKAMEDGS